jgi:hypothetical protein
MIYMHELFTDKGYRHGDQMGCTFENNLFLAPLIKVYFRTVFGRVNQKRMKITST